MATASSRVIRLRASISVVGRTPMTGMWKTQRTLEPMELTQVCTLLLRPLMIEEIVMTVVTPMTMPRMVRPERSLLTRTVSRAILMDSPELPNCIANLLKFGPQCHDGVEHRGLPGRVDAEEDADARGDK